MLKKKKKIDPLVGKKANKAAPALQGHDAFLSVFTKKKRILVRGVFPNEKLRAKLIRCCIYEILNLLRQLYLISTSDHKLGSKATLISRKVN